MALLGVLPLLAGVSLLVARTTGLRARVRAGDGAVRSGFDGTVTRAVT
jgi:hypothetical protein